ncbi:MULTISPECIES: RluA family pseudouridine synthase [unclassified Tolypothrix]|uniref:RluA family pseudouridine synthase n=1 Tax=unclassified Tolypothrix TaxID=2649714 RepID=UPI0005EAB734|nr:MULTISPECIES: RluA family pseudouridine synthase [unclassified Tolypothrix]BAY90556.1 pseudouridine synthase [Microchaete diplosiphon NIES-3275]EKF01147.1 pseudouridine synthase, RluA family [Tolypothrix sp. PCC 7601]MBE9086471.1 RluA family pseudouridine synthase [Tolypothrix sp. LEGE 11397]UYD24713.1 RluA family pseudouridine synthase [Tolypothrix sp. PCC 7712]UYD33057.1 RluA family pseudouridine synthase [Tolypothrix sp. PCC 7601]
MVFLHPLTDFIDSHYAADNASAEYYYEGYCPQSGNLLRLPRTPLIEAIAHGLMQQLASDERYSLEGKMYGVLLVELPTGEQRVIKAFSGLLHSCSVVEGWVPPIPGREEVAVDEARTLAQLEAIKQELMTLQQIPQRQQYESLSREFAQQLQAMNDRHRDRKHQRQEKRQLICETLTGAALAIALEELDEESRQQGIERKLLKRQQNEVLQPLKQRITAADTRIQELKQQRQQLSRQLQAQMHAAYTLINFYGKSRSLQQLMPTGLPTGTGDCCAPKLLQYAAMHRLKPLAMAEFWWGCASTDGEKIPGKFYPACTERCQPLMGFLLSGFPEIGEKLAIIYEDEWLIALNKPAGLLSVPGRYLDTQDSVLSRLRNILPDGMSLNAVHRLDRDTSGILLLARDQKTYRQLSIQFQQQQIHKIYEALLSEIVNIDAGVIELPLWGNPNHRPYQQVNWEYGKPSITHFQVIAREGKYTRIEFKPLTGRTHQLRVHAADIQGLGKPILGDPLYGLSTDFSRLYLHAREIYFQHPQLKETLHLKTEMPF